MASALADLSEFRRLSAALSYQLTARSLSTTQLLSTVLRGPLPAGPAVSVLEDVVAYLLRAYSGKRRKLGPAAAIHLLRTAAFLARASSRAVVPELAVAMLHDKLEDLEPDQFDPEEWVHLEAKFDEIVSHIETRTDVKLMEQIDALTRDRSETYLQYVGKLIESARDFPVVARVKLCDRLDSTLDFSLDFRDPLKNQNFDAHIQQILFVRNWPGIRDRPDFHPGEDVGLARRARGLYKSAIMITLMRLIKPYRPDGCTRRLTSSLIEASITEAQRIAFELLAYHADEIGHPRNIVLDAMDYCYSEAATRVTGAASAAHPIDGLFLNTFNPIAGSEARLTGLADDKKLLLQAALVFISLFRSFENSPTFMIRGIDQTGLHPV
jgi:hypothetical protein